jgi:hypothetical protein
VIYDFTPNETPPRDISDDLSLISRLKCSGDNGAELLKACHRLIRDLPPRSTRLGAAESLVYTIGELLRSSSEHDKRLVLVAQAVLCCCQKGIKPTIKNLSAEVGIKRSWLGLLRKELYSMLDSNIKVTSE